MPGRMAVNDSSMAFKDLEMMYSLNCLSRVKPQLSLPFNEVRYHHVDLVSLLDIIQSKNITRTQIFYCDDQRRPATQRRTCLLNRNEQFVTLAWRPLSVLFSKTRI